MLGAHFMPSTATLTPSGVHTKSRTCTHRLKMFLAHALFCRTSKCRYAHLEAERLQRLIRGDVSRCLGRLGPPHSLCTKESVSLGQKEVKVYAARVAMMQELLYTFLGAMRTQEAFAACLPGVASGQSCSSHWHQYMHRCWAVWG